MPTEQIELHHPELGPFPIHVRRDGEGPGLLLLHGWLHSSRIWEDIWEPLAEEFRVVAVDLPGFGRSPSLPDDQMDLTGLTKVLQALLESEQIVEPDAVVADSMAAVPVVRRLEEDRAVPPRVVLSGPPAGGVQGPWSAVGTRGLVRSILRLGGSTPFSVASKLATWTAPTLERRTDDIGKELTSIALEADPTAAENVFRDLRSTTLEGDLDNSALEAGRVVRGAEDEVIPEEDARGLAQALGVEFVQVEGAGHTPMLERPTEYLRAIKPVLGP